MTALVTLVLVLVYSIGLRSFGLARDKWLPKNGPDVAAITVEVDPRVESIGMVFCLALAAGEVACVIIDAHNGSAVVDWRK